MQFCWETFWCKAYLTPLYPAAFHVMTYVASLSCRLTFLFDLPHFILISHSFLFVCCATLFSRVAWLSRFIIEHYFHLVVELILSKRWVSERAVAMVHVSSQMSCCVSSHFSPNSSTFTRSHSPWLVKSSHFQFGFGFSLSSRCGFGDK